MTDNLVKRLRDDANMQLSVDYDTERAAMFENKAADRIEQIISGPGGIMEMKQTISDKEKQISILQEYIKNAKKCIVDGAYTEAYEHLELVVNDD